MDEIKTKIEAAAEYMERMADNPSVGYDQAKRWGPDYDCSSLVISAWEWADVPVKQNGATYTGNMYNVFLACGFKDVTSSVNLSTGSGLVRGDVLLNHTKHTAMFIGNGKTAEASINEHGLTSGGQTGDQTGKEVLTRAYRNYPWDCVLRFGAADNASTPTQATQSLKTVSVKMPVIRKGNTGPSVAMLQAALKHHGHDPKGIDGDFGTRTHNMLMAFQTEHSLDADGVCGPATWPELSKE